MANSETKPKVIDVFISKDETVYGILWLIDNKPVLAITRDGKTSYVEGDPETLAFNYDRIKNENNRSNQKNHSNL